MMMCSATAAVLGHSERTFLALKPDAVQRGLIGEVITRFERKGLKLIGLKLMSVSRELAEAHYAEHLGKPFCEGLLNFITSSPIVAMVWEGMDAISVCRKVIGATNPEDAAPGTVRFDFAQVSQRNMVHGSDCQASAEREIGLFFKPEELVASWSRSVEPWLMP